jgi:hypothetical protein
MISTPKETLHHFVVSTKHPSPKMSRRILAIACSLFALTAHAGQPDLPLSSAAYPGVELYDDLLVPFAAIYNGTLTTAITEDGRECGSSGAVTNYSVSIGSQDTRTYQGKTYTRSDWDPNPFWFSMGNTVLGRGPQIWLQSTSGGANKTSGGPALWRHWNMTALPAGDGMDFSAKFTNNLWSRNVYYLTTCSATYSRWPLGSAENWTMTGHISASKVSFSFGLPDWEWKGKKYTHKNDFTGDWDPAAGVKLIVGSDVKTEGTNKRIARDESGNLLFPVSTTKQSTATSNLAILGGTQVLVSALTFSVAVLLL